VPQIIFLTGASGAGKTTLVQALQAELSKYPAVFLHFDSIGVPTEREMVALYGSPRKWQRQMTLRWIERLVKSYSDQQWVIFEGQVDLEFIDTGFKVHEFQNYKIVLLHCKAESRKHRLMQERNQPELDNPSMAKWTEYLYRQALVKQVPILDTSDLTVERAVTWFRQQFIDQ